MIHRWTFVEAGGRVLSTGSTSTAADIPAPPAGARRLDGVQLRGKEQWLNGDKPEPRPKLGVPAVAEAEVGRPVEFDVPPGTVVSKNYVKLGEAQGRVTFTPDAPGQTVLQLDPPFPYQPATVTVMTDRARLEQEKAAARVARETEARRGFTGISLAAGVGRLVTPGPK